MGDSPNGSAPKSGGRGLLIAVGIIVPIVVLGMWYSDRISGYVGMQAWSQSGPRQLVDSFAQALRTGDAGAVQQLCAGAVECATSDDGAFTVKLAYGPTKGPPKPAAALTPSIPAAEADLQYDLANAEIKTEMPSEAGRQVTYVLVRQAGAWKIKMALPSGPPGQ